MSLFTPTTWPGYQGTATIYRNAAGTALALAGTVVGVFVPASSFSASALGTAPEGLGGGRYDVAVVATAVVTQAGDELRRPLDGGTARYKVKRVDRWGDDSVSFAEQIGF